MMEYAPNLTHLWIPPGREGTRQTLETMKRLALEDSRKAEVVAQAHSLGNAPAINDWLRENWEVFPDPAQYEYIRTPLHQLRGLSNTGRLAGDCDDASTLAAALLAALSWPCWLIAIRLPNDPEFSHVFCRCYVDRLKLDIDPIVPESELPITAAAEEMEVVVL